MDYTIKSKYAPLLLAFLLIASFIELSYGSKILGLLFLVIAVGTLTFLPKTPHATLKRSIPGTVAGLAIVTADIVYNTMSGSEIQTVDSIVILLGISLAIYKSGTKYSEMGKFGFFFSAIFLALFSMLFVFPIKAGIDLPYYYGHYAVTLPVVTLLQKMNLNIGMYGERLIFVNGVENALLKIDLACFGWYSLLLVISMLAAYGLTFSNKTWGSLAKIALLMCIAVYIANLIRVAILVMLTYYYGVETMLVVHAHLGWIFFALIVFPTAYKFLR
ncbi:archaeosortase C [Geoglobus ahangari]